MIKYIPFKFPLLDRVSCVFTAKATGDVSKDNVKSTIKKDFRLNHIVELSQKHGDGIIFFDSFNLDFKKNFVADAAATSLKGLALMIKSADCQPVLLAHMSQKYIAAFHVGWRANKGSFISKWIDLFCKRYQLSPQELCVVRGPSLSPYRSEFVNFNKEWGKKFLKYYDPVFKTVDLWKMTKDQLMDSGIKEKNIYSIDLCTFSCEFLFSYRRDKTLERQASLVWIGPPSKND